ncbi:MAG: hypothetical protein A2X22_06495 [Bacteroidetes bacterium GWF2_49_14]|nr:MAG: hypothetical protein A2X22_06495 [Bacteroidetes bacterium GWF2_49_14]
MTPFMKKNALLSFFILIGTVAPAIAQTGSVSGVITDSLTGQPVANLTVFIPSSTFGTITNQKGEYHLGRLNPGDYTLMFRHLSYPTTTRLISVEPGKPVILNLALSEESRKLNEVSIIGRIPDQRLAFHLFKTYFLGDQKEATCILQNPQDLKFYEDGGTLKAVAKNPLIITNRHLGYRITFFLDYFNYVEDKNPDTGLGRNDYFSYGGSALFQDLSVVIPIMTMGWRVARKNEFKGSLKHFLAALYRDQLTKEHYYLRTTFQSPEDLQLAEKRSNAMTKIRWAETDSLFNMDPAIHKSSYLHYYPAEEYPLSQNQITAGLQTGEKKLQAVPSLLVFSDYRKTRDLRDDWISTLRIPEKGIIFDQDGNYRVPEGTLSWINHDNSMQIIRLLPSDYMPKLNENHR